MLDSIQLYQIIDEVNNKDDIVHPAVRKAHPLDWCLLHVINVERTTAQISLYMRWKQPSTIRYKWFRRVVDLLNKCATDGEMYFIADEETFECRFEKSGTSQYAASGSISILAYDKDAFPKQLTEDEIEQFGAALQQEEYERQIRGK